MNRKLLFGLGFAPLLTGCTDAASIGIIGGADGPTSVFVANRVSSFSSIVGGTIVLIILVAVAFILWRRNK